MSAETEIQVRKGWFFWQALNPKEPLGTIDSHTVWRARTFEGVIAKAQRKMFPASKGEHEWQRVLLHGDTGCSVFGAIGVYRMSAEEEALLALETVVFGAVIDAIDTMLLQGTVQANGGFWVWQDDVEQVRAAIVAYRDLMKEEPPDNWQDMMAHD